MIRCVIYLDDLLLLDQEVEGTHSNSPNLARSFGIPSELPQISSGTNPDSGVSGIHNQFCEEGAESSTRESGDNREGSQEHSGASDGLSPLSGPTGWKNVRGSSCHSPCPTALSRFTVPQAYSSVKERLRRPGNAVSRSSQGSGMVNEEPICLERESNSGP